MIVVACLRASATMLSASVFALSRLCCPRSAAASPSAISFWRSSIEVMIGGQMNFMQNQTNTIIAIVWPMRVILIST